MCRVVVAHTFNPSPRTVRAYTKKPCLKRKKKKKGKEVTSSWQILQLEMYKWLKGKINSKDIYYILSQYIYFNQDDLDVIF